MIDYKNGNFIVDGVAYERYEMVVAAILDQLNDLAGGSVDKETLERLCHIIINTLNKNNEDLSDVIVSNIDRVIDEIKVIAEGNVDKETLERLCSIIINTLNKNNSDLSNIVVSTNHHSNEILGDINTNIDRVIDEIKDQSTVIGDEWMEKILTDYNILKAQYEDLEHKDGEKDKIIRKLRERIKELEKQLEEQKKKYDKDTKALKDQLAKEIKSSREKIEEIAKLKSRIKVLEEIVKKEGREALLKEIDQLKRVNARLDNELYQLKQKMCDSRASGWNAAMSFQKSMYC